MPREKKIPEIRDEPKKTRLGLRGGPEFGQMAAGK
jgi:hypothetical protein